jgi:hypothetical protein
MIFGFSWFEFMINLLMSHEIAAYKVAKPNNCSAVSGYPTGFP